MNTEIVQENECLLCGSPSEARDVVRNLFTKYNVRIVEVASKEEDKKKMGIAAIRLDISNIPRGAWDEIKKMAY